MKTMNTLFLILISLVLSCSTDKNPEKPETGVEVSEDVVVAYAEDDTDFPNPDRGFYRYSETRASNYTPLNEGQLKAYRNPSTTEGATYSTISTLIFRYFILDGFTDKPLSEEYLNNIASDFEIARKAGEKLIPRFTYTVTSTAGDCPEDFICPPYGDAPKDIVLQHIAQLGPILSENTDVINCIQMGFIGTWGENYYTDYFGDSSSNAEQRKVLDENWQDRIEVLKALLDATPNEIMIQVRYPQLKQRYVYGIDAKTNVAAVSEEEAFTGTDKARIAFHNDCLFASPDDFGTYEDYGNSSSPRKTSLENLKPYFEQDSKYVIAGGETCSDGYSPENDCSPAGMADTDLRQLHYTFLNADYNNEVNNDWVDGGCMESIKKNLGYRFVLKQGKYPSKIKKGEALKMVLDIQNIGYASSMKKRNVKLILRNQADGEISVLPIITNVQKWFSGVSLSESFVLPETLTSGEYDLLLHIADINDDLADRPEYSVRLANADTWEENTGYNNLNHKITVE